MDHDIVFGDWRFDPEVGRLSHPRGDCKLQPRVARLLEFLLSHPGQVLSHDLLIRTVWDGRTVSDDAVRRAVYSLRRALAIDGADQFIKTVAGKGYQAAFPAPASMPSPVVEAATDTRQQAQSWHVAVARRGRQLMWSTAFLLSLVLVLGVTLH